MLMQCHSFPPHSQTLGSSCSDEGSTVQSTQTPTSAAGAAGFSSGDASKGQGDARQVEVRWYDARARTALKKVAVWTNVPWTKMATFECLAAEQAQVNSLSEGDCATTFFPTGM